MRGIGRFRGLCVAVVGCVLLAGGGTADAPWAQPPAPGKAAATFSAPQPPDGQWLVDPGGREYYVIRVPRREGAYAWVSEDHTRVRLVHGLEWDVVSYSDDHFHVKVYRALDQAPPTVRRRQPTAEDLERTAAAYRPEVTAGAGLTLSGFGAGLPQRGQWRNGFDVADVNGDGHLDIVFGPARKQVRRLPTIFLGDGAGAWKPWSTARFQALPYDYGDAKVADLNGDGIPDLVLASHLRGVVALIADRGGRFTAWSQGLEFSGSATGQQPVFSSRAIALADWNGDGRPDILVLGEGPTPASRPAPGAPPEFRPGSRGVVVYLNGGDGTWKKVGPGASRNFGSSIAVADFDRDGRLDFATGSDAWGFTTLLNLGQADGTWKATVIPALRPNALYRAVASADFDGDSRPDLAVSFVTRDHGVFRVGIDVLLNRAGGWERKTIGVVEGRAALFGLATGDLDGDGRADLVGVDGDGSLWIFRGDGAGGFTREPVLGVKPGEQCQGYGIRLIDLDRDGADEIVVSFAEDLAADGPLSKGPSCPSEGSLQAWKVARKQSAGR